MTQRALSFQYQIQKNFQGMTSFAGLPPYLDLIYKSGLLDTLYKNLHARTGTQGWTDAQIVLSIILLNIIGGTSVSDIELLENDVGICALIQHLESHDLKKYSGIENPSQWRKSKTRTFPSPTAIFDFLRRFHNPEQEKFRKPNKAFIPELSKLCETLNDCNKHLITFAQSNSPQEIATLDQDATLVETYKAEALYCYKRFKAYQPLNTYWFEQGLLTHSEFRDGNVPAGFQELRVFKATLMQLPLNIKQVFLRTDGAGYQQDLLSYCAEGKNERFGVIQFAVSAEVSPELKKSALEVAEEKWHVLYDYDEQGNRIMTNQEWAEICYVPNWIGHKKSSPNYRFIAIRERLHHLNKSPESLPFPVIKNSEKHYKLFAIISNRYDLTGEELIHWHRQRCGESEDLHEIQKTELCGGRLPSKYFGANCAWWQIMILTFNLIRIMQRQILAKLEKKALMESTDDKNTSPKPANNPWKNCHLKKIRTTFINLPACILKHGRQFIIRLFPKQEAIGNYLLEMRATINLLGQPPPVNKLV